MKNPGSPGARKERFILFGRYPVPGLTKTRLIPFLGPVGAAELQRHLTEKVFHTAGGVANRRGITLEVHAEGGTPDKMRRWLGAGATCCIQTGGDLGRRMEAAFNRAFQQGCPRAVLFGTDIPGISAPVLDHAMDKLKESDVVLGPSTDGGYWLIGLRKENDLFSGIPWGSGEVLQRTLSRAQGLKLSVALLETLTDVDTIKDVQKLLPDWGDSRPYLSVIIPALNEEKQIKEAVRRALCRDAEVVVVDGGSRDGTREAAVRAGARVLQSPKGRGVQQNHGARAGRGRVLLFLHADTRLPENYENRVFETLMGCGVVLGAFRFETDLKGAPARGIEALVNFRSRFLRLPYGDQGLFIRKALFEQAGGFRDVPIGEDFFLVKRLRRYGRIAPAKASVTTSGRRWAGAGLLRTTWTNQVMLAGFALGISLSTLASIYGRQGSRKQRQD
jgi:uncharacterized protein